MKTAYRNDIFRREDTSWMGDLIRSVGERPTQFTRALPVVPARGGHTPLPAPRALASTWHPAVSPSGLGDIFDDIKAQVDTLLKDLDGLIAGLPVEAAGPFKARRDDCMKKDWFPKYKCLYDLYEDIKKALNNPSPNPHPLPTVQAPAPIPWMWIGIAGAGALALVAIVALARK